MKYKPDWEKTKERMLALWNNEIIDRCVISVPVCTAPDKVWELTKKQKDSSLEKYYTDADYILERSICRFENTYFGGDALPIIFPYMGTGGHAKYLSEHYQYEDDTIWIHPVIQDYDSFSFAFDPNNKVFQKEKKLLQTLADEGAGKFFVGMPDNCGSLDALSQLRGNAQFLVDMLEEPEQVLSAAGKMVDVLIQSGGEFFRSMAQANEGGSVQGWMNTFSPGRMMQLQCDLSVMISPDLFERFVVPELTQTADWLDHAIYHFDGIEQLRHLDHLLSIPSIHMIQWTQVSGQPPVTEFFPALRRIQNAGKGIVLICSKKIVKDVLQNLSPKGLNLLVGDVKSREEADEIVEMVSAFKK